MIRTSQYIAKEIRTELKKELGYTNRQISVKNNWSSIDVVIKDDSVDREAVEKIAKPLEEVDRCEVTGEILAGGNTFVFVR
ncbi:hypothetical protein K2V74_14030 [Mammaliicoccus sciuri]|uniref:hypothetical protein n=1 Tax=Mammaliicoccus sciuri TaxID=1296 RepID=UPI001E45C2A9|nr:hypothetical protein [Mammaliicoccus sciuri]MCD8875437.1 hypothetical protein [Mammaliicoccus sciuri]